jgi:Chaperone of endosialidase/GEVED domain
MQPQVYTQINNIFSKNIIIKKVIIIFISMLFLTSAKSQVIISEIDYDNAGADNNEKIELYGINGTNLTGWKLILYNGANGVAYNTLDLTGNIPFTCGGADGASYGVKVISYTGPDAIQNGSPDGVALVNASSVVVEFLSYEGTFTAVGGPANGMLSIDIAPGFADSNTQEGSFERHANTTWTFVTTNTFGVCNTGLIIGSICSASLFPVSGIFSTTALSSVCSGGQTSLSLDLTNHTTINATFQWLYKNASTSNVFVNLGVVDASPTKITTVTQPTDYYCIVYCNGNLYTTSTIVSVGMYSIPTITTAFTVDCNAHTTLLSLTGLQAGVSYTYQWQKNINNAGWNNIGAATSSTLTQPTAAYAISYRCNITACGGASSSTSLEVTPDNANCYCLPLYYDPCGPRFQGINDLAIRNIVLNTLLNFDDIQRNCDIFLYANFPPTGSNTTNLNQGLLYNLHVDLACITSPSGGGSSLGVWIDYNDNYIFETSERVTDLKNLPVVSTGIAVDIPLTVPTNAPLGLHRMRIREANSTQGLSVPPCDVTTGQFVDGETEDYTINIVAAPACTGGISVGGTVSANQTVCIGVMPAPLTLSGNTGAILFWQKSVDAAFTNPTNILITSNTLNPVIQNSNTYYRAVVQNINCAPAYSSAVQITVTNITGTTILATTGQVNTQNILPTGTTYFMDNCKLIATSVPTASSPAAAGVTVTIDASLQNYNGTPYLQRHYDYQTGIPTFPSGLQCTLYYLQSEFTAFNTARGSYKSLPISGNNADVNIANIRVVKYEGSNTGGGPGSYPPGTPVTTTTPTSVNWNAAHNWWEITTGAGGGIGFADGTGGYFIQSVFDCVPPAVTVSNVSPTGATAFWNLSPGSSGFEYALQTVNTAPTGAGTATNNTLINLSGLTPNTNYYFFTRTNCGNGSFSAWASTNFFTALSTTAKIGIGTIAPSSNVEIASTGIPDVRISSTNSFGPARLSLLSDKGTATEWRPGYIESGTNGDYTGRLDFYTNGTGNANKFGAVKAMSISNGNVVVTGTVTANGTLLNSDARFKTNIITLPNSLNNLLQLRGTQYYFNKQAFPNKNFSSEIQMGLIAQEVEKIYPELVSTDKDGYKSVNYVGLMPVMIESIKEQQLQIEIQQKQIEKQQQQIDKLSKAMNQLLNK